MTSPRASILVVATSGGPLVRGCLERLEAAAPRVPSETIVVLHGVDEAEAEDLRRAAPGVRVESSEANVGLAGALNLGRAFARGEFIVSLHDDVEVRPGWLEALVEAADREPGAGAIGSLVLGGDGRVQAAGWELMCDGSTRPPWPGEPPEPTELAGIRPVDYSPSCSLLIRASTWDRAGGADERFFPIYYIDVDLCLAIRVRGERVLCEPASVVVHHQGASSDPDFAGFVGALNRELLVAKWGELLTGQVPGAGALLEPSAGAIPGQERAPNAAARERGALLRDAPLCRQHAAILRSELKARGAELATTRAELELTGARLAATDADLLVALGAVEAADARAAGLSAELVRLRQRVDAIGRVEAGGWWRLRARLDPALRLAARARSIVRR